jgi:integrase
MRKTLTDKGVAALKPRPKRYAFPDPELRTHYVRVTPNGAKSFAVVVRGPDGKQVWATIGTCDAMSIDDARKKARPAIERLRAGLPAFEVPATRHNFENVTGQWLKRHVQAKGLRSEGEVTRLLNAHVFPKWKDRDILNIRRSDVAALLDHIEDKHSARQADAVLAIVRGIMNWFASRHDNYAPPITKGMRRTNPKERARARILDDNELRTIWKAAESNGAFGAIVRLLLLTAQRRQKVVAIRWQDVSLDGTWTILTSDREKGNAGEVKLPQVALDIIRAQPQIGDNPYVFAGRGNGGHFNSPSKSKRLFDSKLPEMPQWQLHDLRRTARSLMARAGVRPDIAERVMGHAIAGVEGVYDRHAYTTEKADALKRLSALIQTILRPHRGNVTKLARGG